MEIGKASYGGNFTKTETFKLKDGESVYRILPPLGRLAKQGRWSQFYNVHFGYTNSAGKLRPFQSSLVKNNKTKMIEVPDAALERINKLKAAFDEAKKGNDKELIARLDKLVGQKGQFNIDNNHHMNAMTLDGKIGVLKLRHRAKLVLDAAIKALDAKGVDPLSVENGRFFVFKRTGMGLDTSFQVSVYTETLNIEGVGQVQKEVVSVLGADVLGRIPKEARELDDLYPRPTADEIARIVAEGATAVDEILGNKAGAAKPELADDGPEDDYAAPVQTAPQAAQVSAAQSTPVTTPATAQVAIETRAAVAAPAPQAAPAPVAQAIQKMSDEDFLKSL